MSVDTATRPPVTGVRTTLLNEVRASSRTVLIGLLVGMVSVGVLGRIAMFVLAQTNPTTAGMTTDDGFTIGQFTLSGSLNLLVVGAAFGALSGVLHVALAPLAIGPAWFRRLSLSVGAGVVAASQVVHSEGIDFVALDRPFFLAIGMFLLIPVLHVLALDLLAEHARTRDRLRHPVWTILGVLCAIPFAIVTLPLLLGRAAWLAVPSEGGLSTVVRAPVWPWALRGVLAVLFALAVASLGADVAALT
jgi:hypothetical protein